MISLLLLSIESVWLAFSAIYPLPFDEYYHVGIIQIYARQWTPFIHSQPASAAIYGDVTRLPSYLYHYLMSFPYRFFSLFFESETALIILMRLINIVFVVTGILILRKLFLKANISPRVINVAVLFFVITPIVPLLSAHVNYDNLLFLITASTLYVAYLILVGDDNKLFRNISTFVILGMTGSLVKYTFLPFYAGIFGVVLFFKVKEHKAEIIHKLVKSWSVMNTLLKVSTVLIIILTSFLFLERFGLNVLRYKSPNPNCIQVQPFAVCEQNMPWYRDYAVKKSLENQPLPYGNFVSYSQHWFTVIMRGYFAIFSHNPTLAFWDKEPFGPIVWRSLLPIQICMAYALVGISALVTVVKVKQLHITRLAWLVVLPATIYTMVLWVFNYVSYLDVHKAYAIQARYTLIFLLPFIVVLLSTVSSLKILTVKQKVLMASLALCLYAWGGGIAGWIIRSDPLWYWQNATVISVNQKAQKILKNIIPH